MGNRRRVGLVQLENDTCLREGRKGCTQLEHGSGGKGKARGREKESNAV